jgi:beta-glucosidase
MPTDVTARAALCTGATRARRPAKELKGFGRVNAKAGQTVTSTIYVRTTDLDFWSTDADGWTIEADTLKVQVEPNSGQLPLSGNVIVVH